MNRKAKAAPGATGNGLKNHSITGVFESDFQFDNAINQEKLQRDLSAHLKQHKTIRQTYRCFGCEKGKSLLKMSRFPFICRECVAELRGKGKVARNHFIEKMKANIGKFLRGCIVNG